MLFASGSVQSIDFDSPVSDDVSATDLERLPVELERPSGSVLGVVRITVPPEFEDTSATITFSVPTEVLEQRDVAAKNLQLARYNDGWEMFDTTVVERTGDRVIFSARTPGLSVFAAVGQPTDTPTVTPAPTDSPTATPPARLGGEDQQDGLGMPGIGGLLGALVLVIAVRLRRRGDDDVEPAVRS